MTTPFLLDYWTVGDLQSRFIPEDKFNVKKSLIWKNGHGIVEIKSAENLITISDDRYSTPGFILIPQEPGLYIALSKKIFGFRFLDRENDIPVFTLRKLIDRITLSPEFICTYVGLLIFFFIKKIRGYGWRNKIFIAVDPVRYNPGLSACTVFYGSRKTAFILSLSKGFEKVWVCKLYYGILQRIFERIYLDIRYIVRINISVIERLITFSTCILLIFKDLRCFL